jgi:hypothetical protein
MSFGRYACQPDARPFTLWNRRQSRVVLRTIVDIYFLPNKTVAELHEEINRGKLDLLPDFSNAAREELSALKY